MPLLVMKCEKGFIWGNIRGLCLEVVVFVVNAEVEKDIMAEGWKL